MGRHDPPPRRDRRAGAPQGLRHGRARLRATDEREGVGSERARRRLQRPDGRRSRDSRRYRADQLAVFALEFVDERGLRQVESTMCCSRLQARSARRTRELIEPHRKRDRVAAKGPTRAKRCASLCTERAARRGCCARRRWHRVQTAPGTLTEPRAFNLMFKTHVGALEDRLERGLSAAGDRAGHLRQFQERVRYGARASVPFGIGQIGKAFRNEINPRNFTFRSREFEQMEIEFFCRPAERRQWYEYWRERRFAGTSASACERENLHLREHEQVGARALRGRLCRRRIRLPVRPQRARGHREPDGLRLAPAHADERQGPHAISTIRRRIRTRGASCLT